VSPLPTFRPSPVWPGDSRRAGKTAADASHIGANFVRSGPSTAAAGATWGGRLWDNYFPTQGYARATHPGIADYGTAADPDRSAGRPV